MLCIGFFVFLTLQGQNAWENTERYMYTGHLDTRDEPESWSSSETYMSDVSTGTAESFESLSGDSEVFDLDALD